MKNFLPAIILLFFTTILAQNNSPYVVSPSLNSDGSQIAFSYQGDIWTVSSKGGTATRLTIHEGYDGFPKWSPDNSKLAFTSTRYGNSDVFTISSKGGSPKRLTYYSSGDALGSWADNKSILFTSRREYRQIEWTPEIYEVSAMGGTPYRKLDAFGNMPSQSPDGKFISFVRGSCRLTREQYKGPANREVWLYNKEEKKYIQLTNFDGMDIYPVWGDASTLYYASAKTGRYNIYRIKIDANGKQVGNAEQLTSYKENGTRYLEISKDGSTLVFERGDAIYTMNTSTKEVKEVKIQVSDDYRYDMVEYKTFSSNATEYAVSPNGKLSAFVVRGELFVKENDKEKSRSINVSNHSFRDNEVTWLSDTSLVFVSDRDGQFDLYLLKSADKNQTNLFKSLKHEIVRITDTDEDESIPLVSPDGKKLAYLNGRGKFIVAEIDAEGDLSNSVNFIRLMGYS